MSMTAIEMQAAIHYFYRREEFGAVPDGGPPPRSHADATEMLIARRLIERDHLGYYRASDGLRIYVEALAAVPLPVQRWVIPDPPPPF